MPPSVLSRLRELQSWYLEFEHRVQFEPERMTLDRDYAHETDLLVDQFPEVLEPQPAPVGDTRLRIIVAGLLHEEVRVRVDACLVSEEIALTAMTCAYRVCCKMITCRAITLTSAEKLRVWVTARFNFALRELRKNSE